MPLVAEVHCRSIGERVGTELRWSPTADETEVANCGKRRTAARTSK
ncbi:hypothetical protein [Streptomyces rochei]